MLARGATLALDSWGMLRAGVPVAAGFLAAGLVGALGGCGDESSRACATTVSPEVCATPGNLRAAGTVQVMWVAEPQLELGPEPLADGRYLLTGRALSCGADFSPPAEALHVQGAVEISGCVLRATSISAEGAEPEVSVATFSYGADHTLELSDACSASPSEAMAQRYGFDGTTMQLPISVDLLGGDGNSYPCSGVDTYELL